MLGVYNNGWFGGSIPAAAISESVVGSIWRRLAPWLTLTSAITAFGCLYIQSNWSWRIPMIFQGVPAGFVLLFVWFIPESPRWLMQNGRYEEALAFLVKYHGDGNPESPLVKLEFEEFKEGIALDGTDKRWWDYRVSSVGEIVHPSNSRLNAPFALPGPLHDQERPMEIRHGHYDLRLWSVFWKRSRLL
jgi:hypothetical protein